MIIRSSLGGSGGMTLDATAAQHDSAVWADTSSTPWVGNKAKYVIRPSSDGTYTPGSNWVVGAAGVGGPAVYQAVNEAVGDQDSSYITTNTLTGGGSVLDRASWNMQDVPSNTTNISHISHTYQARAAPPLTTATINGFLDNGTLGDGTSHTMPSDGSYIRQQDNYMLAPGAVPWTKTTVNAIAAGVRVTGLS
jgi:hypothetical protein